LTARLGGDIVFWFADALGAGVSAATAFTSDAAEDGRSYVLGGPALGFTFNFEVGLAVAEAPTTPPGGSGATPDSRPRRLLPRAPKRH
jgi:hypothetical protein